MKEITIEPPLNDDEYNSIQMYLTLIEKYFISGSKKNLEKYMGFSLDAKQSFYLHRTYCPNIIVNKDKIVFKENNIEQSHSTTIKTRMSNIGMKNAIRALESLIFFFFEQPIVNLNSNKPFISQKHSITGKLNCNDFAYEINNNKIYYLEHNTKTPIEEQCLRFFLQQKELSLLKENTKTQNISPSQFKL